MQPSQCRNYNSDTKHMLYVGPDYKITLSAGVDYLSVEPFLKCAVLKNFHEINNLTCLKFVTFVCFVCALKTLQLQCFSKAQVKSVSNISNIPYICVDQDIDTQTLQCTHRSGEI